MTFFQPRAYIDYIPPKLSQGKEWYVYYSVKNPSTGKMKRFRIKVNRWKTIKEKKEAAKAIIGRISEQLALGWNPIIEDFAPKSFTRMSDALDIFLDIKKKELEKNSLRSYVSYVRAFSEWLRKKGFGPEMYISSFTKPLALEYMEYLEQKDGISPRTYNNYLSFLRDLFNWFLSRGFVSANHFDGIKKKPKRLTKKIRRTLSDQELGRLSAYLKKENPIYLAMCLMCYCCFLRPKEIALLRCRDVDLKKQLIHVGEDIAKNDNSSVRTIPDSMMEFVRTLDLSRPDYFLFGDHLKYDFSPGPKALNSRKIAKYWEHYVRPECHFPMDIQFYSLKDTGVTNMIGSGVPISFVQQQADHSSIAMTAVYLGKSEEKANSELKGVDIIK